MGKANKMVRKFERENQPKSKEQMTFDRKVSLKRLTAKVHSLDMLRWLVLF